VLAVSLIPLVLTVLLVRQPTLPPTPTRSLSFDGGAAATQGAALLALPGGWAPGEPGDQAAAAVVASKLGRYGYHVKTQFFGADLPGRPNVSLENVIAYKTGTGAGNVAVIAHRDGTGTGADDNASSTGVMLELARELASQPRQRGLIFVSTDGGTTGGQGAAHFASSWAKLHHIDAAIVLDAIAAPDGSPVRIVLRADAPRGTSATVVGAARRALGTWGHVSADMPGALDQLTGLAVPYAVTEQGPLVARGIPAVTLTSGPTAPAHTHPVFAPLVGGQLGRVGNAVINLVAELDTAPQIDPAGHAEIYLQSSVIRGILLELALAALLAPFITCVLDAVARCRRRRLPLAPAMAALGWRCATWLVGLVVLWLLPLFPGHLASGVPVAPPGRGSIGLTWTGILLAVAAALVFRQFVARPRIAPVGPMAAAERTTGFVTSLLGLVFASLAIVSVNPFALILVLPAAHAWLWMEAVARRGRRAMLGLFVAGAVIGPLLVLGELWRLGLGASAFRAVLATVASGYFSPPLAAALAVALGAGAQLATVIAGRYSPARRVKRGYN
jgi:Peptidase family M28